MLNALLCSRQYIHVRFKNTRSEARKKWLLGYATSDKPSIPSIIHLFVLYIGLSPSKHQHCRITISESIRLLVDY